MSELRDNDFSKVYDSATEPLPFAVGTKCTDKTGSKEYIFVAGVSSVVIGSALLLNMSTLAISLIAANGIGKVAVSMGAIDATTKYGWVQVRGLGSALTAATVAADKPAYIGGSGVIDDAVVAGDMIVGMTILAARTGAGLVAVNMDSPVVTDTLG